MKIYVYHPDISASWQIHSDEELVQSLAERFPNAILYFGE